jgi:transcriptional regulator with GAF, ATPase, and Fis domain
MSESKQSAAESLDALRRRISALNDAGERSGLMIELEKLTAAMDLNGSSEQVFSPPSIDGLKLDGLLGNSGALGNLLQTIATVAPTNLAILLEGETGTGKEKFAQTIHNNSGRSKFVAVNCGAFPTGLIESELFGHVKGAFTGASSDRKGKFEEAHEGTIFLDEIGELEPFAQVKLLRVLELGEIQRVGSDQARKVNVRIIAATNRDLDEMVQQGKFREDLFYRINMCPLTLPPLRERRSDIPALFDHFLKHFCAELKKPRPLVDEELRHFLFNIYDYHGNIRELRNICQYIACVGGTREIQRVDLPLRVSGDPLARVPDNPLPLAIPKGTRTQLIDKSTGTGFSTGRETGTRGRTAILRQAEQSYWVGMLKKHKGSIQKISEETGLSPSRIYQILERCRLKPKDFR